MEGTPPETIADSPAVAADAGAVLEETKVTEGNRGEDYPSVGWKRTLWSTLRVPVSIPYRSEPGSTMMSHWKIPFTPEAEIVTYGARASSVYESLGELLFPLLSQVPGRASRTASSAGAEQTARTRARAPSLSRPRHVDWPAPLSHEVGRGRGRQGELGEDGEKRWTTHTSHPSKHKRFTDCERVYVLQQLARALKF